jgi:hypothetical protein
MESGNRPTGDPQEFGQGSELPIDMHALLGGYATGTLTPVERDLLFTAALKDQVLFDALMDEEALRELLAEPETRTQLFAALDRASQGLAFSHQLPPEVVVRREATVPVASSPAPGPISPAPIFPATAAPSFALGNKWIAVAIGAAFVITFGSVAYWRTRAPERTEVALNRIPADDAPQLPGAKPISKDAAEILVEKAAPTPSTQPANEPIGNEPTRKVAANTPRPAAITQEAESSPSSSPVADAIPPATPAPAPPSVPAQVQTNQFQASNTGGRQERAQIQDRTSGPGSAAATGSSIPVGASAEADAGRAPAQSAPSASQAANPAPVRAAAPSISSARIAAMRARPPLYLETTITSVAGNTVTIGLGSQVVRIGQVFEIRRGQKTLGTVRITEVSRESAQGLFQAEGQDSPSVGDGARIPR